MIVPKLKKYPAFIIMAAVVALDQITKHIVRTRIPLYESITVGKEWFGETFRLTHLTNTGAAFSISWPNPAWNRLFFMSTSVVALIFIIWLLWKATHKIQVVAFGLVMGGAIGNNLIDRPIFGGVTDFVDVNIPNIIRGMERFPVFNVADSAIFIAMCLLIFDILCSKDKQVIPGGESAATQTNDKELDKEP